MPSARSAVEGNAPRWLRAARIVTKIVPLGDFVGRCVVAGATLPRSTFSRRHVRLPRVLHHHWACPRKSRSARSRGREGPALLSPPKEVNHFGAPHAAAVAVVHAGVLLQRGQSRADAAPHVGRFAPGAAGEPRPE